MAQKSQRNVVTEINDFIHLHSGALSHDNDTHNIIHPAVSLTSEPK